MLAALISGGHVLLEDVPGTAKTILARAIAQTIEERASRGSSARPDLQPTDVTGLSIFDQKSREFIFRPGPIFATIVLVDEINRAMPRTQSALLEAMAEGQVTVDGVTRALPEPFLVIATENPIEHEGTFPLPEAQLDRFALRSGLGYPARDDEVVDRRSRSVMAIPSRRSSLPSRPPSCVQLRRAVEEVYVDELIIRWTVDLVRATRSVEGVEVGASVRGSLTLERTARAWALLQGRDHVLPGGHRAAVPPGARPPSRCSPRRTPQRRVRSARDDALAAGEGALPRHRTTARAGLGQLTLVAGRGRETFPLVPRHALTGLPFGNLRSHRRGPGSEVIGSRPYRPGDPVSTIDWGATARLSAATGRDEFVVRERVADDAPRVAIVLDRRPSMSLYAPRCPGCRSRRSCASAVAAVVASAARRARRPRAARLRRRHRALGAARARRERRELIETRLADTVFAPEDTIEQSLAFLGRHRADLPGGSFVFVLSDFLSPPPASSWLEANARGWDSFRW